MHSVEGGAHAIITLEGKWEAEPTLLSVDRYCHSRRCRLKAKVGPG